MSQLSFSDIEFGANLKLTRREKFLSEMKESLYDSLSMREFARLSLKCGSLPDETTILNFRHLLERKDLATRPLAVVNAMLGEHGLLLRLGPIVDVTIISAPSSTKNERNEQDPEMHANEDGQQLARHEGPHWCGFRLIPPFLRVG